jgi:thiol-disulfide isomerase/thioredoxin
MTDGSKNESKNGAGRGDGRGEGETEEDHGEGTLRVLVFVAIFIAGLALISRVIRPPQHALAGKPAPEFALSTLDTGSGSQRIALSDLKGKAVLLDFWATWCGPCNAQSPILDGLSRRMKDRGLVVVGVNTSDTPQAALSWAQSHRISYPIVLDEDNSIARSYGVGNLPTLVILAKDGTVHAVRVGLTDAGELERLVQKEL